MSKMILWNLFTCKGTYIIDWVGRTAMVGPWWVRKTYLWWNVQKIEYKRICVIQTNFKHFLCVVKRDWLQPRQHFWQFFLGMICWWKSICAFYWWIKSGPEPLEKEIHKILGSKREDWFCDPFWKLVQKISGSFFRTCFITVIYERTRGHCESSRRSARR